MEQAGIKDNVKEIIFSGLDKGFRPDMPQELNFVRSLPNDKNLLNECILALYMNDVPLPFEHGFPLRLIVPGWHGMAHVKWLSHITASSKQFKGPFQTVDYVYITNEDDYSNAVPVTESKVNSIISWQPGHYSILARAVDSLGNMQPKHAAWNAKRYSNNSIHKVDVVVPAQKS